MGIFIVWIADTHLKIKTKEISKQKIVKITTTAKLLSLMIKQIFLKVIKTKRH